MMETNENTKFFSELMNKITEFFSELMKEIMQTCKRIAKFLSDFGHCFLRIYICICRESYPKFAHLALYSKKSRVRKKYLNRLIQKNIIGMFD